MALCNKPWMVASRWRMADQDHPYVRSLIYPNPMANYFPCLRLDVKQTGCNQLWQTFSFQWFSCSSAGDSSLGGALSVMAEAPSLDVKSLVTARACPPREHSVSLSAVLLHARLIPGSSSARTQSGFLLGLSDDASKDNFLKWKLDLIPVEGN